jgi:hypothetical protein
MNVVLRTLPTSAGSSKRKWVPPLFSSGPVFKIVRQFKEFHRFNMFKWSPDLTLVLGSLILLTFLNFDRNRKIFDPFRMTALPACH